MGFRVIRGSRLSQATLSSLKATTAKKPVASKPKSVTNSLGMSFALIPTGEFTMGSPANEQSRSSDEQQHQVKVTKTIYFGRHEVTNAQFRMFVQATGYTTTAEKQGFGGTRLNPVNGDMNQVSGRSWRNPGNQYGDQHPVVQVSWDDANAFLNWLIKKEGRKYRLPTEAEWEYAARAGSQTRFSTGNAVESLSGFANIYDLTAARVYESASDPDAAQFDDRYSEAAPVGQFRPNPFGLYDMHGNVWEWCYDTYDPNFYQGSRLNDPFSNNGNGLRILRGGCYI